jgi:cell division septal protein FtsQ
VAATRPRTARARAGELPASRRRLPHNPALVKLLPSGRSLLAGLALVAAVAGLYAAARGTSLFAVRELRIQGATPALAQRIEQELAPVVGQSLVGLDAGQVLARLEALPAVQSASLDRAFPHALVLTVVRERPAAVLRRGSEAWLVSARGRVLGRLAQGADRKLPRIWAEKSVQVETGGIVADVDVREAVLALRAPETQALPIRVRTVRSRGGDVTFVLANGLELRLGENVDVRLKLAVAAEILPLVAVPSAGGPTYLDLGVPGKPVAGRTLNSEVEVEG